MKRLLSLLAVAASVLTFGVGQAAADEPGGPSAQVAGESAESGQIADGSSGGYQDAPSNRAISVRVLSPGDDGAVTQSNQVNAASLAANGNETDQSVDQTQAGAGYGSDSTQVAGQEAENKQSADADATAVQKSPSNEAINVRVLSPGSNGDVTQSNEASAGALAANGNKTDQTVDQTQAGGGYGSDSTQVAGQDASSKQSADADATAVQLHPTNESTNVRVLSPGDNGDVSQSNSTTAIGAALNGNKTDQTVDQEQGKGGYGSDSLQVAGQDASNKQGADADATALQLHPSNESTSVRVLSKGDDGDVSQSNSTTAVAAALNGNKTDQSIGQAQGQSTDKMADGRYPSSKDQDSDSTQIAGQESSNAQWADADAIALQKGASNENTPVRVGSKGDNGDVWQSNSTTAVAAALNGNKTDQDIDQTQGGSYGLGSRDGCKCSSGSDYLQVAGQESKSAQWADADAIALQKGASNENTPVAVLSGGHGKGHGKCSDRCSDKGDGGDVWQSNSTTAVAAALNGNKTDQSIHQAQPGGFGPLYLQAAGQRNTSWQGASAGALAAQFGASNENTPVRVGSKGGGGSLEQANSLGVLAAVLNLNTTKQAIGQKQHGHGGDNLQASGQDDWSLQYGDARAFGVQGVPPHRKGGMGKR